MTPHIFAEKPSRITAVFLSALLFICLGCSVAYGRERLYHRDYDTLYDYRNIGIRVDVECHSGTPPVLEWVYAIGEKEQIKAVSFDFESDGEIDLKLEKIRGDVLFRGSPYRIPGTYTASLFIETTHGVFMREYVISYNDFFWGRDNFRFANDGTFENRISFISNTIVEWAQERFGELSEEQETLVIYLMYTLYKGSIGRCYGFSGGESYYILHPEAIPDPYTAVYDIDELDPRIVKQMDFLQNDIVFRNFIIGKLNITDEQSRAQLEEELGRIRSSIERGKPVIMPYLSVKMHHSMVVYGYFEDLYKKRVTLLVANNWEREQQDNVYSEDAENIVIDLSQSGYKVSWFDLTKRKHRYPKKIFAVSCDETPSIRAQDFLSLLERTRQEIIEKDRIIIMVEQTEQAYVVDEEGKKAGYSKPKRLNELDEIDFKKIDYNYVFGIPKGDVYTLHLKTKRYNKEKKSYKHVNIFGIVPVQDRIEAFVMHDIDLSAERMFSIDGKRCTVELQGEQEGGG